MDMLSQKFWSYELDEPWNVVRVIPQFPCVEVTFADELSATFDFSRIMETDEGYKRLQNPAEFRRVGIAEGVLTWAWGLSIPNDVLYPLAENSEGKIITLQFEENTKDGDSDVCGGRRDWQEDCRCA